MKVKVRYADKTGTVGYGYIDIATSFEKKLQERGRELGATMAWMDKNDVRGIKYDDKMKDKGSKRGLEWEGKEKG